MEWYQIKGIIAAFIGIVSGFISMGASAKWYYQAQVGIPTSLGVQAAAVLCGIVAVCLFIVAGFALHDDHARRFDRW